MAEYSPALNFSYLQYDVSAIEQFITASVGIESFVFTYYFTDSSNDIQLLAYAYLGDAAGYATHYDELAVYGTDSLRMNGPLKLSNNVVSVDAIQSLINPGTGEGSADFLVFTPNVNSENHVYYNITAYKYDNDRNRPPHRIGGAGSVDTNPSPPAV